MSTFQTYLIGFIVLLIGLAIAAYLLGVPAIWIVVGAIILLGIGIISATGRNDDPRTPRGPQDTRRPPY